MLETTVNKQHLLRRICGQICCQFRESMHNHHNSFLPKHVLRNVNVRNHNCDSMLGICQVYGITDWDMRQTLLSLNCLVVQSISTQINVNHVR